LRVRQVKSEAVPADCEVEVVPVPELEVPELAGAVTVVVEVPALPLVPAPPVWVAPEPPQPAIPRAASSAALSTALLRVR
jgi:hypothetical protein